MSNHQKIVPLGHTVNVSRLGDYPIIEIEFYPPQNLKYEDIISRVMGHKKPICNVDMDQYTVYPERVKITLIRLGMELRIDDVREYLNSLHLQPAQPLLALMPFMIPSELRTITNSIDMFSMVTFWGNPDDCVYLFLSKRCGYMVIERPGKLQYLPPTVYFATTPAP
jgi:hypothetical protein